MKFKKDEEGKLVLDDNGDPIAVTESGEVIPLDKVVSLGKHTRVEAERDEYKGEVEKLRGQIDELSKQGGDAEELKAQIEELKTKSDAAKTESEQRIADKDAEIAELAKGHAIDTALLGAGVPEARLKAAKALLDIDKVELSNDQLTGLDVETFKKDNAYLFDTTTTSSAAASRGAAGASKGEAVLRESMGLPPEKAEE